MHVHEGVVAVTLDRKHDVGAGGSVGAGVRQEVGDNLMQAPGIAEDEQLGQVAGPVTRMVGVCGLRVSDRFDRQRNQVDRGEHELLTLIESGEEQEVLHEARHAYRLRLNALECRRRVLTVGRVAQRQLGVAADRR